MAQLEHHLLSLPDDEIIQNLRRMALVDILEFSLISERSKDLVKSIQIKGSPIHVTIDNKITISIETDFNQLEVIFYREPDMYWGMGAYGRKKKLTAPQSVTFYEYDIARDNQKSTWMKNTLTMQYWLKHLQDVFNYPETDAICFSTDSFQFDIDDIKEVFGTASSVLIQNTGCYAFNQMVFEKFFPIAKIIIEPSSFPNSKIPGKILMQNFDYLDIDNELEEPTTMTLDELLLINSKVIVLVNLDISPRQLNKFIKLWQKGSNRLMEHLHVEVRNFKEGDKEVIMKGIKHQVVPAAQTRKFKTVGLIDQGSINGGFDFYRMDRVKATIKLKHEAGFTTVEMYIWFDHCVVE